MTIPCRDRAEQLLGREAELHTLRLHLVRGTRLLTITGPGGVGKTALLQAALGEMEHPVLWVDAHAISDQNALWDQVEQTLQARTGEVADCADVFQASLRGCSVWLVLDTLEQVSGAGEVVQALLTTYPELRVLTTSRRLLGLRDEVVLRVTPLALPQSGEDPASSAAVALLVRLAQRYLPGHLPGHVLSAELLGTLAGLAARLDGLPLALELAAAQWPVWPPAALLGRLKVGRPLVTGPVLGRPERHRSLDALTLWSQHLLTAEEQTFFCRLGVLEGNFSPEMAGSVTDARTLGVDALTVLDRLAQLHLVCASGQGPQGQFRLLYTVRDAARAELYARGEIRQAVGRLAEAAIRRCEALGDLPQTPAVCAALDDDRDALHVALREVLACPPEDQEATLLALRLVNSLQPYWEVRGDAAHGRALLSQALGRSGGGAARLHATIARGVLAAAQSDWVAALLDLAPAVTQAQQCGDQAAEARAQAEYGRALWCSGQAAEALAPLQAALDAYAASTQIRAPQQRAAVLTNLGNALKHLGELGRAETLLTEALGLHRVHGDLQRESITLCNLGLVHDLRGNAAASVRAYTAALNLARQLNDRSTMGLALNNLACLAGDAGESKHAADLFAQTATLLREVGDLGGAARALTNLASVALSLGDITPARHAVDEALEMLARIQDRAPTARTSTVLAAVQVAQGDLYGAQTTAQLVWPELTRLGLWEYAAQLLVTLADLRTRQGEGATAAALLATEVQLRTQHGVPRGGHEERLRASVQAQAFALLDPGERAAAQAEGERLGAARLVLDIPQEGPRPDPASDLTARELEVLHLLAAGLSNKAIARELELSVNTVRGYLTVVFGKLNTTNRTAAARVALERGLLKVELRS